MKKKYPPLALLLTVLLCLGLPSCEDSYYWGEVDCSECYTEKPEYGYLVIRLTISPEYPEVPVTVYRNEFEQDYIEYTDTLSTEEFTLEVPVNQYYSVTAAYRSAERTVLAVDGDRVKTSKVVGSCDETCWVLVDGKINVRLRYD